MWEMLEQNEDIKIDAQVSLLSRLMNVVLLLTKEIQDEGATWGNNIKCSSGPDECEVSAGVQENYKKQKVWGDEYVTIKEPLDFK